MQVPSSYKAMCRQCGDIVQHRLGDDEARRSANGHFVAPTIARTEIIKPRPAAPPAAGAPAPKLAPKIVKARNMSPRAQQLRAMAAHNHRMRGRAIKKQQQRDG